MGGNIPGANFLGGGNFSGGVWWVGISLGGIFPKPVFFTSNLKFLYVLLCRYSLVVLILLFFLLSFFVNFLSSFFTFPFVSSIYLPYFLPFWISIMFDVNFLFLHLLHIERTWSVMSSPFSHNGYKSCFSIFL